MLTENNQMLHSPRVSRLLIACGVIGPILFILVFLVEGATRPGYSAWHNFVSDLSQSDQGWMQIALLALRLLRQERSSVSSARFAGGTDVKVSS